MIPVILIFSRTKIMDSFMPLIPLLIVGNEQLQVTFPPSPALTLSVMPWIRMAYNSLWAEMVVRLEQRWRHQQIAASGVSRLGISATLGSTDQDTNATVAAAANGGEEDASLFDRRDLGRTIVGALLMPAISSVCGRWVRIKFVFSCKGTESAKSQGADGQQLLLFIAWNSFLGNFAFVRTRIPDNFHRNILGGCLFVLVKDLAGLFGTYQEYKRKRVRRIREYAEFKDERQ